MSSSLQRRICQIRRSTALHSPHTFGLHNQVLRCVKSSYSIVVRPHMHVTMHLWIKMSDLFQSVKSDIQFDLPILLISCTGYEWYKHISRTNAQNKLSKGSNRSHWTCAPAAPNLRFGAAESAVLLHYTHHTHSGFTTELSKKSVFDNVEAWYACNNHSWIKRSDLFSSATSDILSHLPNLLIQYRISDSALPNLTFCLSTLTTHIRASQPSSKVSKKSVFNVDEALYEQIWQVR
jgi:hypothetical protein